jgi:hypothetical protein
MNSKKILAVAVLSLLAAAGANAEEYDGVHPLTHSASRAQVHAEAVIAAHSPDPYAEGYGAGVPPVFNSTLARATVYQEAVAAAHSPDPYAEGYGAGVPEVFISSIDRRAVKSQAVAAARAPRLNVWGEAF